MIRARIMSITVDVVVYNVSAGRHHGKRRLPVPMLLLISDIPSISRNIDTCILFVDV
jgi:hypothetical protein